MKSLPEIIDEKSAIGKSFLGSLAGGVYAIHEPEAGSRTWSQYSLEEQMGEELRRNIRANNIPIDTEYVSIREYQIARKEDITTYFRVLLFFRDRQEDKTK